MNDVRDPDPSADQQRKQLIDLFLKRTLAEVEQMRRNVPRLIGGDLAAWRDLRFDAQRIMGTSRGLELGVLSACASELAALAAERLERTSVDAQFLLAVTTAIEMVAIEISRLTTET
jgi:hypothetical protein